MSTNVLRVILDSAANGVWNMAVDQALLESVELSGQPVVRIYHWVPATLSLGYFQVYRDRDHHDASLSCPAVRRTSGGGAIMHDQETTYSLCVPSTNRWASQNTELYETVHNCITAALADWDVDVQAFDESSNRHDLETGASPFLCFQRRYPGDLLLGEHKVVGSAQRRSRNALLQHGSVLWERSKFAPELPGINDLAEQCVDTQQFEESLVTRIAHFMQIKMERHELTTAERKAALGISEQKFALAQWTEHRLRNSGST